MRIRGMNIRLIKVFGLSVAALLLTVSDAGAGRLFSMVSSDEHGITVEVKIPEAEPVLFAGDGGSIYSIIEMEGFYQLRKDNYPVIPTRRLIFSVPEGSAASLDFVKVDYVRREGINLPIFDPDGKMVPAETPEGFDFDRGASFARLGGTGKYRKRDVVFVDIFPVLFSGSKGGVVIAKSLVIRLNYGVPSVDAAREDPLVREAVFNKEKMPSKAEVRRGLSRQRTPFEFALSSHWIKMRVGEPGVYCITYDDIFKLGINPSQIDPASVRIFSSPPLPQPDSINSGGSFEEGYHLEEIDIIVKDTDGAFQPGDSIIFYAIGVNNWVDYIDPTSTSRTYLKHPYDVKHVYWLTWGGDFGSQPARMQSRDVSPGSYDLDVDSYEARMHVERDLMYDAIHTDDGWYWRYMNSGGTSTFNDYFILSDISDQNGIVRTIAYGAYVYQHLDNSASFYINSQFVGDTSWTVSYSYNPSAMRIFERPISNLREGSNTFKIVKPLDDQMYVQWYEIFYHRRLKSLSNVLDFFSPDTIASVRFNLSGFTDSNILLLDVTDFKKPVVLTGYQSAGDGLVFNDVIDGSPRHFFASSVSSIKKPSLRVRNVTSLRDETAGPDMVIIYYNRFREAAFRLKAHREEKLPFSNGPVVKAVDIEDVYDNFSGGLKDPIAIRNYLKFLYDNFDENGSPKLKYALLIGEGTYDHRNLLGRGNDLIPLYMNIHFSNEHEAVEDEDFLAKLDDDIDKIPDVAIGRLSVVSEHEANSYVDRIVEYENNPEDGPWKDKFILVADDEYSSNRNDDFVFMIDAEELASRSGPIPTCMDIKKIYLHVYPFVGGAKPDAKRDLLKEWNDGALIVNYSGHGSPLQLADERVMSNPDVYNLTNANRRPLFLAFSCSVGDLDSPYQRSMAQNLVNFDNGGAIATMCAAAPTYGHPNSILNAELLSTIFTSKDSTGTVPIGVALQLAKMHVASDYGYEKNNSKYILLGDPAMTLDLPKYSITHDVSSIDTMKAGFRYSLSAGVIEGDGVKNDFNGEAEIIIQEAEESISENLIRDGIKYRIKYVLPGNVLFRGTSDVVNGGFGISFVVPKRVRVGPGARIRSYAYAPGMDGAGACDTLVIATTDSFPPNNDNPVINMHFAGMATKVKSGARLIAEISDSDGIAILGSEPQNSIMLMFDGSGFPIFVTDYFRYEHGSYTKGWVEYPLNTGFKPGKHSVVLKAFDNLGASSSDTLNFEVVEDSLYLVTDVFNFPNPFSEGTNFVFQLSDDADVDLKVFNVSGFLIWEKRITGVEGFNSIYWDGRDLSGDIIANGTYIYQLDVMFRNSFHREEKIRGKVVFLK